MLDAEFSLFHPKDDFVRTAGFGKQDNVFIVVKRRHARNAQLERPYLSSNGGDVEQTWRVSFDTLIDFDRVVGEDQLSIAAPIRSRIPHFSCNDVVGFPDEIFQCQTLDGRGFQARDSQQHSGQRGQTFELHSGSLTHGRVVTWAPYGRES